MGGVEILKLALHADALFEVRNRGHRLERSMWLGVVVWWLDGFAQSPICFFTLPPCPSHPCYPCARAQHGWYCQYFDIPSIPSALPLLFLHCTCRSFWHAPNWCRPRVRHSKTWSCPLVHALTPNRL